MLIVAGIYAYDKFMNTDQKTSSALDKASVSRLQFQCEDKVYCSEMTSYEEAVFYLRNCQGTKMDGDGDGISCERQF